MALSKLTATVQFVFVMAENTTIQLQRKFASRREHELFVKVNHS